MTTKLKYYRELHNETQEDIAKICGVSKQTVFNWENGFYEMKLSQAIKIANYYNISLDSLVGRDNNVNIIKKIKKDLEEIVANYLNNL